MWEGVILSYLGEFGKIFLRKCYLRYEGWLGEGSLGLVLRVERIVCARVWKWGKYIRFMWYWENVSLVGDEVYG